MQLHTHTHHCHFKVPASWTPRVFTCLCWCLAVFGSYCFSDCMVHLYFFTLPKHCPQTCYLSPDTFLHVTSSELRGSPQCIAFERFCTCQHLLQRSVKSVMQKFAFVQEPLAISENYFQCLLVWHYMKRKTKKKQTKQTTNSKLWPYYYYYYYYYYYTYYYYSNTSGIVLYLWMQTLSYICKILHCINFAVF